MSAPPLLLHVFPTFVPAGAQMRVLRLAEAFGPRFRHALVALDGRTEAAAQWPAGVELRLLAAPPKAGSLATAWRMRALLERERPDLVLTYNFGAIDTELAARTLRGVRVVHHEDGFSKEEARVFLRRRVWLRRWALPAARRVVVISRTLERVALEVWRLPRARVVFIPNGIDAARFAPRGRNEALRAELRVPAGALLVGAVGHLRPEKNLPRLFAAAAAAAQRADVHLLVLGDGPERARLEALAAAPPLAGRVHFTGHIDAPRGHYAAMDVFALSSDTEQMPIALLEAMASALPAVSTDVGDVRAILPPSQQPYLAPAQAGGEAQLAEGLLALAADAGLRARLGTENLARVRTAFTLEVMVESYRAVYEQALSADRA